MDPFPRGNPSPLVHFGNRASVPTVTTVQDTRVRGSWKETVLSVYDLGRTGSHASAVARYVSDPQGEFDEDVGSGVSLWFTLYDDKDRESCQSRILPVASLPLQSKVIRVDTVCRTF